MCQNGVNEAGFDTFVPVGGCIIAFYDPDSRFPRGINNAPGYPHEDDSCYQTIQCEICEDSQDSISMGRIKSRLGWDGACRTPVAPMLRAQPIDA